MAEAALSRCPHCDLPVRARPGTGPQYCCLGCRLAAAAGGAPGAGGATGLLAARLLFAAFLAMGVMTFSLVLYSESLHSRGDEPGLEAMRNLGRLALAFFSLPVLALLAPPLLAGALTDLRAGRVRMDGLIVLAVLAAFGLSVAHTWAGTGEVYYDTATMVLVLVTFGRRLEAHARRHGQDAASTLAELLPEVAHRLDAAGAPGDVAPGELRVGDEVEIRPGEAVPADVVVRTGRGEAACAHLTGEQAPRPAGPGDELPAGATCGTTLLRATVLRPPAESSLARLGALLDEPLSDTRLLRLVDRLAGWLAGGSIALALVAGGLAARADGAGAGLRVALAVLLVACPCALGLATPLAYRALRAALARRGLLVHDAAAIERAARLDVALLDKTGTLTEAGAGEVELVQAAPGDAAELVALVTASGHALGPSLEAASAGAEADGSRTRVAAELREVRLLSGLGVRATRAGQALAAGSPAWLDAEGCRWDPACREAAARALAAGHTSVALARDGHVVAHAALAAGLLPGAREAVSGLRAAGLRVVLLSGDRPDVVAAAAAALGADEAVGGALPEDKLERVRAEQRAGRRVLCVGDGVNDAPALRAADLGVAIARGTAAARATAGVELVSRDPSALALLPSAARALRRTVTGNLAWTLAYNFVLLALAASGRLAPIFAAAAMIVSSLFVATRSWKLLAWGGEAIGAADAGPPPEPSATIATPDREGAGPASGRRALPGAAP